ncbi:YrdB family protein [Dactylosporangium sp. NPDC049525]|uniref:YrdB family protein n=1 Tax=Dactylosporangium sp. NPDC049525 TaxID=3154730 RepID=UPI003430110C
MLAGAQMVNLAVRFLAELAVLAAVVYWGFTLHASVLVRVTAGVGGPLLLIVIWALWGAPKAAMKLDGAAHLILDVAWFGSGVLALWAAGRLTWALILGVVYVVNLALILIWKQA